MPISIFVWNKIGIREIIVKATKIIINRHNRAKLESCKLGRESLESLISGCVPLSQAPRPSLSAHPIRCLPTCFSDYQTGRWIAPFGRKTRDFCCEKGWIMILLCQSTFFKWAWGIFKKWSHFLVLFHTMSLPWEMLKREGAVQGSALQLREVLLYFQAPPPPWQWQRRSKSPPLLWNVLMC